EGLRQRGGPGAAAGAEQEARAAYERLLAEDPGRSGVAAELAEFLAASAARVRPADEGWSVLTPAQVRSDQGTALTVQPDGSVLASGPSPANDAYTVVAHTALAGITAVRLEVLPDPSLPHGGSGRAPEDGTFVLSALRLWAPPAVTGPGVWLDPVWCD